MTIRTDILDEIKEFTNLAKASKSMPFAVPNGYFEKLSNAVYSEVQKKNIPFSAPGNEYFAGLTAQILAKVKNDEDCIIPANKINPYLVPDNYFNSLSENVFKKIKQPTKVISIQRKIYRWTAAVAACMILALGITYLKQEHTTSNGNTLYAVLNNVPTDELMEYASSQGFDTDSESLLYFYSNDEEIEVELNVDVDLNLEYYSLQELETYLNIK